MDKWAALVAAAILGAVLASCGPTERTAMVQHRETELKAFKPITYRRTADGIEERISIAADGSLTRTRTGPALSGKLNEYQVMQLKRLFDGWDGLKSAYPASASPGSAGSTTITYADKAVTVGDSATDVPELFVLARRKIEQYVRDAGRPVAADGSMP